jgi:heat shock protein HtpX
MYKQIAKNKRNTIIIMVGFVLFITAIGSLFAQLSGDWTMFYWVLGISIIYTTIQYFASAKLAVLMTGGKEIQKKDNPRLYNTVENLAITAGVPMPKVYLIDDPAPNAFAAGRNPSRAVVAATTGLLNIMDNDELTAVMAHEMSHVRNYDIRVSMIVFGLVCIIGFIADLGIRMLIFGNRRDSNNSSPVGLLIAVFTIILAPIAAALAQMAISRQREYLADSSAALLTKYPEGMISALGKLQSHSRPMRHQNAATEALFISNPMKKGFLSNIFSTHPPIEKRIERLKHGKKGF